MSSMKAVRMHAYGGVDVLAYEDAPCPAPAAGEVLIQVRATSVNPFDLAVRAGYMTGYFNHALPLILGTDVAGVVAEAGPNVTDFKAGDEVYGRAGVYRDGAYAQFVVASAADIALKPRSLDFVQAAALPHVTLTAWQALIELADLAPGQTILIHGAAGGVGHIAVQLAHWRGAHVIGTASRNVDLLRELGVEQMIDYEASRFEELVHDVDVVLDTVGGDTQARSWQVLKPGGILVSVIQPPSEGEAAAHGVRAAMVMSTPPIGETLAKVAELVDVGAIKPQVSAVFPLADIQKAHAAVAEKHVRGKVVVQVA